MMNSSSSSSSSPKKKDVGQACILATIAAVTGDDEEDDDNVETEEEDEEGDVKDTSIPRVLVLTLDKHRHGIWITELVRRLSKLRSDIRFEVVAVDQAIELSSAMDALAGFPEPVQNVSARKHGRVAPKKRKAPGADPLPESTDEDSAAMADEDKGRWAWNVVGVINRVSDASPPDSAKRGLTLLRLAELRGIPVLLNGSNAHTSGMSKVAHHAVIHATPGCKAPKSIAVARGMSGRAAAAAAQHAGLEFPLMFKPNAGGFGAGIEVFSSWRELLEGSLPFDEDPDGDGIGLLQEEIRADRGETYRCFVLGDKLQCAVAVNVDDGDKSDGGVGVCAASAKQGVLRAWSPPEEISRACIDIMKRCGADCGSVELLLRAGVPYYFDVNMLSTLPTQDQVSDKTKIWPERYDPWDELAGYTVSRL